MRWDLLLLLAALLIGAGLIIFALAETGSGAPEDAKTITVRVGSIVKGELALLEAEDGSDGYACYFPGVSPTPLSEQDVTRIFGPAVVAQLRTPDTWSDVLLQLLNITTWASLIWVAIGAVGQVAFFLRMTVQWLASEKQRQSVVPEAFWWLSFIGGVMLFTYFIWRRDIIGVAGQSTGVVVYGRNLRLIYKSKQRLRAAASGAGEAA